MATINQIPECPHCGQMVFPTTAGLSTWVCGCGASGTISSLDRPSYQTAYFTFGSDHSLPDGSPARDEYVKVVCPSRMDPRGLLICWLGSNRFASEYNEQEWVSEASKYYSGQPAAVITVYEQSS